MYLRKIIQNKKSNKNNIHDIIEDIQIHEIIYAIQKENNGYKSEQNNDKGNNPLKINME